LFAVRRGSMQARTCETYDPPGGVGQGAIIIMAATGEFIRLVNYVDDIVTTLRRISATLPVLDAEERKRLADHLNAAGSSLAEVITQLKVGAQ
jgi:hypothetical protein